MLARRRLGIGTGRPKIRDGQRLLERQAGRHDLTHDALRGSGRERAGIALGNPPQHLRLALGTVDIPLLYFTDATRKFGPLVDQAQQIDIDRVDSVTKLPQLLRVVGHSQLSSGRYRTANTPSMLEIASITVFLTLLSTSTSV